MHELICTDETFDPNFTIEYKLSIQVSLDGFSFCILDDIRKKYLVFKHFPFRLSNASFLPRKTKEIVEQEDILSLTYKSTQILIENASFAAIPNISGFQETPELFLRQNFNLPSNTVFHSSHHEAFDFTLAFGYSGLLKSLFDEKFGQYKLLHYLEPSFKKIAKNSFKKGVNCIINATSQYFCVLVFEEKNLLFLNSFIYKNNNDFLYYLLFTMENLGIKPNDLQIYLSGILNEKDSLNLLFEKYNLNSNYLKFNRSYQYSYTFESIPEHAFLNVINSEG